MNTINLCRMSRKGHTLGTNWWSRMQPWVQQWAAALQDTVHEPRPFTSQSFGQYLEWYIPRTRTWVTYTPRERQRHTPSLVDVYPTHRDRNSALAVRLITVFSLPDNVSIIETTNSFNHLLFLRRVTWHDVSPWIPDPCTTVCGRVYSLLHTRSWRR